MTKRKVPAIADLINQAIIRFGDIIDNDNSSTNEVRDATMALIAIDKNNRDFQIAIKETIVPNMTDDELRAELQRTAPKGDA